MTPERIWTIGHARRSSEDFLGLLAEHGIEAVADVRRFPGSRASPWFGAEELARALAGRDVAYRHFVDLGGRRRPRPDSPHTAWRLPSFRGYADHMDSREFRTAYDALRDLGRARRTALLCAETAWWRCHRALISDLLKAEGVTVLHIMTPGRSAEHPYTSAARIVAGRLDYGG